MPIAAIRLQPGLDTELTPTYDSAAYDVTEYGRFRAGMFEKLGGWTRFYPFAVDGTAKDTHPWQDLNGVKHLAVATTTEVDVITSGVLIEITPQDLDTDAEPDFTTTSGDATIEIDDPNISNVTAFDAVEFRTPVAVAGVILSGVYQITTRTGTTSYTIEARSDATATRANTTINAISQANPAVVGYDGADNWANGDIVYISGVVGMTEVNGRIFTVANVNAGANTFELAGIDSTGFGAYVSGGILSPAQVPEFTTTLDSPVVTVELADHGQAVGNVVVFPEATSVGGLTVQGKYNVLSVPTVDTFTVSATTAATSAATAMMNGGEVAFRYYIALAPGVGGLGYGLGDYGEGGYGLGGGASADQVGIPITATDYTLDNWGELLLVNPEDRGLFYWGPNEGLLNAKLVIEAPLYISGMFVSQANQQVIAYGASINAWETGGIGVYQDPLLIAWCDISNFFQWTPDATNQARNFRIPTGSEIIGGASSKNRNLIWTDLELWGQIYSGPPYVYSTNRIGENCGLIGKHAVASYSDAAYWMGKRNFFVYAGAGVQTLPCSVWDFVFQDLDENNQHKSVAASNSDFTEIWFFFPSVSGGTGLPDKAVKYNVIEGTWDTLPFGRLAWSDRSVLGNPIGVTAGGLILSHESGYDADGAPMTPRMRTGYFYIEESQDFVTIDRLIPDFRFGPIAETQDAQIMLTLYSVETPSETPVANGPYLVTQATGYVTLDPPVRNKQFALEVSSSDNGSFWRLGLVRFRYAPDGRR